MNETVYQKGTPAQRGEIIDFINYVFSHNGHPHDFKRLLPKAYGDEAIGIEKDHFLALQEGRIRGVVALRPMVMHVMNETLSMGFVGSVSVHPYSRGEGHMKRLMAMMLEDAKAQGMDLLVLGGIRQRYNYFGFEQAGLRLCYTVYPHNIKHALRDVEDSAIVFTDISPEDQDTLLFCQRLTYAQRVYVERPLHEYYRTLHNWNWDCKLILRNGEKIGYLQGNIAEIRLTDEKYLPEVLKACFRGRQGNNTAEIPVALWERERIESLRRLSENSVLSTVEMIRVLNWKKVLAAHFALKAAYLPLGDGRVSVQIENETPLEIKVEKGIPTVTETEKGELVLSSLEAHRLFFGMENAVLPSPLPFGWLPLPFFNSETDGF